MTLSESLVHELISKVSAGSCLIHKLKITCSTKYNTAVNDENNSFISLILIYSNKSVERYIFRNLALFRSTYEKIFGVKVRPFHKVGDVFIIIESI